MIILHSIFSFLFSVTVVLEKKVDVGTQVLPTKNENLKTFFFFYSHYFFVRQSSEWLYFTSSKMQREKNKLSPNFPYSLTRMSMKWEKNVGSESAENSDKIDIKFPSLPYCTKCFGFFLYLLHITLFIAIALALFVFYQYPRLTPRK